MKRVSSLRGTIGVVCAFLASHSAWAKPEYATKQGVSCVACHVNVWGGGPRNVYGKFYGSRGLPPGKFSNQDLFYASARGLAYYPKTMSKNSNGFTLMEAAGSVNAPVIEASDSTPEVRFVGTYNMAPVSAGAREAYARVTYATAGNPIYVTIGRFNAPFGLLTDEHRTYTRLQTNTTLNNFFDGVAVSGTLAQGFTADVSLVNDLQTGSGFNTSGTSYGLIGNFRWMPSFLPLMLGVSQNYDHLQNQPDAYATSGYTVVSFDRMSSGKVPLSLLFESVVAKEWNNATINPNLGAFFIPSSNTTYQPAITDSTSLGFYSMLRYDLNPRWAFFYKYDRLTPDMRYDADSFQRHGFGFELTLNSNAYVDLRFEKAIVGQPDISGTNVFAAEDDFWAMIRLWI